MSNSLNGGTAGVGLSPANSGGASGDAFDVVDLSRAAGVVFDRTHTRGAGLAAKHTLKGDGVAAYGWSSPLGGQTVWYGRTYVWLDKVRGDMGVVAVQMDDGSSVTIEIARRGQMLLTDAAGAVLASGSSRVSTRGWVRIEWKVDHERRSVELRLYNDPGSTTPTETLATQAGIAIGTATARVLFGIVDGSSSTTFWTDDSAVASTGYVGPA